MFLCKKDYMGNWGVAFYALKWLSAFILDKLMYNVMYVCYVRRTVESNI